MLSNRPFDAVLLISFGGPQGLNEIRPFLANVLRGRNISAKRVKDVEEHYRRFKGVSPLTAITMRQADGLRDRLPTMNLPVYVGMRNWHPFLEDTLSQMSEDGIRCVLAVMLAPYHSYSSCGQYKQNVLQALGTIGEAGHKELQVTYVAGWHTHAGFIDANVHQIQKAITRLPSSLRSRAALVFTAHSIPVTMATDSRYVDELRETAALVAQRLVWNNWTLVFQSRSGQPEDPWLEPDISDYLRAERAKGLEAIVVSPIGFVADHIEVLYDLDTEVAHVCQELGITMSRAQSVNDHPSFLDMLADVVRSACQRYDGTTPLPIVPTTPSARTELPPPAR